MISIFHNHNWKEIERFVALPITSVIKFENATAQHIQRMLFGMTTIFFRCDCGEIKQVEILGISIKK